MPLFAPLPNGFDITAVSGICGSISISCWVVVFTPQILENFRRQSADGLSLLFVVVWLAGDVFNILGAVLQGVLPTMVILAVYYTFADLVLLGQCLYYRGRSPSEEPTPAPKARDLLPGTSPDTSHAISEHTETSPLLRPPSHHRKPSSSSTSNHLPVDATHLSPATPFVPPTPAGPTLVSPSQPTSTLLAIFYNTSAIVVVCLAGVLGWWLSYRPEQTEAAPSPPSTLTLTLTSTIHPPIPPDPILQYNLPGQIFGYLCAVLYLGSRIPQILLNHARQSTEGVSLLFFLFACIGNLTYVLSIFAFDPVCRTRGCIEGNNRAIYVRYLVVNASWLLGSAGTLVLDLGIFVQFFWYRGKGERGRHVLGEEHGEAAEGR